MISVKKQKVTIALDEQIYQGLVEKVGKRKIGAYLSQIARPHVIISDLDQVYAAMAADESREREVQDWQDAPIDTVVTE